MSLIAAALFALVMYALFWTVFIVSNPIILCFTRRPSFVRTETRVPTCWVVIPAHDAAHDIGGCINACAQSTGIDVTGIIVIADHCLDDTAKVALNSGAVVLERNSGLRGKTYALDWFFEGYWQSLCATEPVVITDATARVEHDALANIVHPLNAGFDVSVGTAMICTGEHHWLHIGGALSLQHRALQNRCRASLGLTPLIEGRLMAFSSRYLNSHRWQLAKPTSSVDFKEHPTEDWRHGLRLAQSAVKVAYAERAIVRTPLRSTVAAGTAQAKRWDSGRRLNAWKYGLPSLINAVISLKPAQFVASLDAVQPPQIKVVCIGLLLAIIGLAINLGTILAGGLLVLFLFAAYYAAHLYILRKCESKLTIVQVGRWVIWRISTLI